MFTGIIETLATVTSVTKDGTNLRFTISSNIAPLLKVDQSVAHNGVCLTVIDINKTEYAVTAVAETLAKTMLATWQKGDIINIELALRAGDRLDGHFVQGHVDAVAECREKQALEGSWLFRFRFPEAFAPLIIEKGSICINGVSLTAFNVKLNEFTVTIIPYTFEHTNIQSVGPGTLVNLEFDIVGKYVARLLKMS